jgi:spore germination protein YaaH
MKKYFIVITLNLFVFISFAVAQEHKTIHQIEYEKHLNVSSLNLAKGNNGSIIPLKPNKTKSLTKAVFGYYPDWEYLRNSYNNFKYNLLTHIAAFDFTVTNTGSIGVPAGWPWTEVINNAHTNGVKMIMVVVNFNKDDIHKLITNSTSRWVFMNGVKAKIKQYNLDGVNIDFEGLLREDRGSRINSFMQELSDTVHNISSDLEVSFAAPAVNWGGWDLEGLANSCDYLFIMGYDFFGSWSTKTGPTAPLVGGYYNVTTTITREYKNITNNTPEKLILGVPYFGPHWTTSGDEEGATVLEYQNAVRFRDAQSEFETYGTLWSSNYQNSWYRYLSGFTQHQVWVDNDSSLSLKYDLAISKNLKGVGMWALGYDGNRTEFWDLLEDKLVAVKKENTLYEDFSLSQNFPNPFNPTTIIKFNINAKTFIRLSVFDILGKEISTLVNEEKQPGTYEITFDASNLPSGTYYYQLRTDNYLQTKKMILLK